MSSNENNLTPMMRQYLEIKDAHQDSILFFRLGDFYEMFFDDAIEATRILHITLTARESGKGNKIPMCGVPHHAASNYIARLIKHGRKVAICEQVEEPTQGKTIVKREVVKIITPGTFMADDIIDASRNNFILSINVQKDNFGLAYADISTGEFRITELSNKEELFTELYKISPSECLVSDSFSKDKEFYQIKDLDLGTISINDDWYFDEDISVREIKNHFSVHSLDGFGCTDMNLAIGAGGALLKYLKNTQKSALKNINLMSTYRVNQFMTMDRNTHRHLELTQNQEDSSEKGTLLNVIDKTKTPMGKRRLKRWLLNPLLDIDEIEKRLETVQYFFDKSSIRIKTRELLGNIYDIERLSNKVSLGTANARDMIALSSSLKNMEDLKKLIDKQTVPGSLTELVKSIGKFDDVIKKIEECVSENPPNTIKEGGIIKEGFSAELEEVRYIVKNGKGWIQNLQKDEIERTGIGSLKVGYNRVFGYYIEVTKSNLDAIPSDYVRKQTLANAERFITEDLKKEESKIIGAEDRSKSLEYEIFCDLRQKIGEEIDRFKKISDCIADIDVLVNFSEVAVNNKYSRPKIRDEDILQIDNGRHPVLERILKDKEFIPNDVLMNSTDERIFIITGSNMAGKSTYIRQVALITIMAQMGCFIPADNALIGIIDRVFTRVGASDRLYRGMSTFMVEMLETANILNNATKKSLIILDEIGRGTSTFDGVSIAWAVVEYIHHKLQGAKAMFATHYHELTELTGIMEGVKNYHLAVQEWNDEIVFLYKVSEGSCDESFGIHVAKLAGMPKDVVNRSREILGNLHKDSFLGSMRARFSEEEKEGGKQLDFFDATTQKHPIIKNIQDLNIDELTPLKALEILANYKKEVENGE